MFSWRITTATGHIERWPSRRPARHVRWRRQRGARVASSVAIVSVVWFTNTSWRRDQISEPYRALSLIERRLTVPPNESIGSVHITGHATGIKVLLVTQFSTCEPP